MDFKTAIQTLFRMFRYDGEYGVYAWPLLFLLFGVLCVAWFFRALHNRKKRNWDILFFSLLVGALFLWAACVFVTTTGLLEEHAAAVLLVKTLAQIFLPCLLHLHIWKQVSYKELTPLRVILNLSLPVAVSTIMYFQVPLPAFLGNALNVAEAWWLAFYTYSLFNYIRCFVLCFSVFYQMPKHMRKSSYYMIAGTAVITFASLLPYWERALAPYHFPMLLTGLGTHFIYEAQFANNVTDVIATSRNFMFNNLSTMVLILSKDKRILDWNRGQDSFLELLPAPRYRERYESYRARVIREGAGQMSAHVDDIMLLNYGGMECQFLLKLNEIRNKQRVFGYVAEISEITPVYTVLRLFEDIATVDLLTSLLNRNAYLSDVQRFIEGEVAPLWVVVGDVNNLKQLNDTMGHLVGDRLLTTLSGFIKGMLPTNGKAYRIGGDEFVLLLPGGTQQQVEAFINGVHALCAQTNDPNFGTPSVSWGYAVRQSAAERYNDVLAAADKMMYAQKKAQHHFTSSGMVPMSQP